VFMDSDGKRKGIRISIWVAILGLLLGVLSSIVIATDADAHTALRSVSPKDRSTVSFAPTKVVLTFTEAVSTSFATVTVTGPQGPVSKGKAAVDGVTLTQALTGDLPNGRYTVAFRVVSDDGHPVSDQTTFTVAAANSHTTPSSSAPTATPLPASPSTSTSGPASPDTAAAAAADESGSGRGWRIGLAVGVAALALAAGTALVASTRRRSGE
jgi:methionine-rich copper-binding protein CopC